MNANPQPANVPTMIAVPVAVVADQQSRPVSDSRTDNSVGQEFDAYASQYESALNQGLSVSGEGPEYFAQKRIDWTAKIVSQVFNGSVDAVLDFGCGVGIATPLLQNALQPDSLWGFDPSTAAIERAKKAFANESTHFTFSGQHIPANRFDLAYCNGVFHHILPQDRPTALATVFNALKPGGWFAFWENNPWNPGTRYVMSKIPFDRDAVVISPLEAKQILSDAGFKVARSDAWFLFPRSLSWLRRLETVVHRLPLGAQYVVFAQKPAQ